MTAETLLALAERCEKEEASFELECAIARAVGFYHPHPDYTRPTSATPKYASSLDAAVGLVPEGNCWDVSSDSHAWFGDKDSYWLNVNAKTPALALCAAALRARAALSPPPS